MAPQQKQVNPQEAAAQGLQFANPKGEGTYRMVNSNTGTTADVPYSQVQAARGQKLMFLTTGEQQRYQKDSGDPVQRGAVSSFIHSAGVPEMLHMAGQVLRHPIDSTGTALQAGWRLSQPDAMTADQMAADSNPIVRTAGGMIVDSRDHLRQAMQDYQQQGLTPQVRREFGRSIPVVGPVMAQAQAQHDAGNTSGAIGTMLGLGAGLAGPKILKGVPGALADATQWAGDAMEGSGVARMGRFLNAGEALPGGKYNAPAEAVLEQGPGTSIAGSRASLTAKIKAARIAEGQAIHDSAAASSGRVNIADLRSAIDSTISPLQDVARGPGGNAAMVNPLNDLRASFEPGISENGDMSASDALELRDQLDKNIDPTESPNPNVPTTDNALRGIRGKLSGLLYDAAPEVRGHTEAYEGLTDAEKLSVQNQGFQDIKFNTLGRYLLDLAAGVGTGKTLHSPVAGLTTATATHVAPMLYSAPLTQTGLATGLYQAGRAAQAAAPLFDAVAPSVGRAVDALAPAGRSGLFLAPASNFRPSGTPGASLAPSLDKQQGGQKDAPTENGEGSNNQNQHSIAPNGQPSVPQPTKGPIAWMNQGAAKLMQHIQMDPSSGLTQDDIANLAQTKQGQALLTWASNLTPGSPGMGGIANQLAGQTA